MYFLAKCCKCSIFFSVMPQDLAYIIPKLSTLKHIQSYLQIHSNILGVRLKISASIRSNVQYLPVKRFLKFMIAQFSGMPHKPPRVIIFFFNCCDSRALRGHSHTQSQTGFCHLEDTIKASPQERHHSR